MTAQTVKVYNTMIFTEVFENVSSFKSAVKSSNLNVLTDDSINILYYLLYAKYGNSPIANDDTNQFKYKLYSIIFQYGGLWEKKVTIQKRLRELSEAELLIGSKIVYNKAFNDSGETSQASLEDIVQINEQQTQNQKKSILGAYAELLELLSGDATGEFINKFQVCFKQFVIPEETILYEGDD